VFDKYNFVKLLNNFNEQLVIKNTVHTLLQL
jgi:hypothetical protein